MNTVEERTMTTPTSDELTVEGLEQLSPISNPNPEEDWQEPPFVDLTVRTNGKVYRACILKIRRDKESGQPMHAVHLYDDAGEPIIGIGNGSETFGTVHAGVAYALTEVLEVRGRPELRANAEPKGATPA